MWITYVNIQPNLLYKNTVFWGFFYIKKTHDCSQVYWGFIAGLIPLNFDWFRVYPWIITSDCKCMCFFFFWKNNFDFVFVGNFYRDIPAFWNWYISSTRMKRMANFPWKQSWKFSHHRNFNEPTIRLNGNELIFKRYEIVPLHWIIADQWNIHRSTPFLMSFKLPE